MSTKDLTQNDLMALHVAALYTYDAGQRMLQVNQWDGGLAPRFFLGRTVAGHHWRFRHDVPSELAQELSALSASEPRNLNPVPKHYETYLALLEAHAPVKTQGQGPAYVHTKHVNPLGEPLAITAANAHLLEAELSDWLPDVTHRQPFMAALESGDAVSLCASVRITDLAHEAGVETAASHRRKGHAFSAVAGWSNLLLSQNIVPLYSTSFDNSASQQLAEKLGFSLYGVDFHIT